MSSGWKSKLELARGVFQAEDTACAKAWREGRVYAGLGMQEPLGAKCKVLTQTPERKSTLQLHFLTLHPKLMAHPFNHPRLGAGRYHFLNCQAKELRHALLNPCQIKQFAFQRHSLLDLSVRCLQRGT